MSIVLTDRTRMETDQVCPMLRYLTFHWKGTGLVPVSENYELTYGKIHHSALSDLMVGDDPKRIIAGAGLALEEALPPCFDDESVPPLHWRLEQQWLMQCLLWVWTLEVLPRLLREYRVVETEREFEWVIGSQLMDPQVREVSLVQMLRLDCLLEQKDTGSLYYKEFKTTGWGDWRWATQFEHNAQVMSGLKAVEEVRGIRPVGVLIEGHLKGRREKDRAKSSATSGLTIQTSPLCYVWETGPGEWAPKWPNGGVKRPAWELFETPFEYVTQLRMQFPQVTEQLIQQLPPIDPDPFHVERWRRQVTHRELEIARGLNELDRADSPAEEDKILDRIFPLHETSCIRFGRKCSHYEVCHGIPTPGAFEPRIPNHPLEGRDGGVLVQEGGRVPAKQATQDPDV